MSLFEAQPRAATTHARVRLIAPVVLPVGA
ncbi:MAG: hypothetical protein QOI31_1956 [Solirubrobacterales bacterium]|jgi:hypothetical protein|nr:hypothetical protein [Solirubrobacterales bacterium]